MSTTYKIEIIDLDSNEWTQFASDLDSEEDARQVISAHVNTRAMVRILKRNTDYELVWQREVN